MGAKIPVSEMFGPVFQGEGPLVGTQTWFLRLAGCDYRCTMCDSLHAVLPEKFKDNASYFEKGEIGPAILPLLLARDVKWITISGGNPAMWDLDEDLDYLEAQHRDYKFAVETQGTIFRRWLTRCKSIAISPKGPGMGYGTIQSLEELARFIEMLGGMFGNWERLKQLAFLKIPILCEDDLRFATIVHTKYPHLRMYLSSGNTCPPDDDRPGCDLDSIRTCVLNHARVVTDMILEKYPVLSDCVFFPQQHVLLYGNAKGK